MGLVRKHSPGDRVNIEGNGILLEVIIRKIGRLPDGNVYADIKVRKYDLITRALARDKKGRISYSGTRKEKEMELEEGLSLSFNDKPNYQPSNSKARFYYDIPREYKISPISKRNS